MIKNIVFDFGGVLVEYDFRAYFKQVLNCDDEKADWFMQNVFTPERNDDLDRGVLNTSECVALWKSEFPEYASVFDEFNAHYRDIFTGEVPGVKDFMKQLKTDGFHLFGLSNWSMKFLDVVEKFPEIFSLVEDRVVSYQVNVIKPERAIYVALLDKYKLRAEECVFIDDKEANVIAARELGIHGIVFKNTEQLRKELSEIIAQNA